MATFIWARPSSGQMTSPSFLIPAQVVDGGGEQISSDSFDLLGVAGQPTAIGFLQSPGFFLQAGFVPQLTDLQKICYPYTDGDTYGGLGIPVYEYPCPSGYTETSGDCDDTDPDIHPGATEECDGIDNNCNNEIDEDLIRTCPPVYCDWEGWQFCSNGQWSGCQYPVLPWYYRDTDEDGYGDPNNYVRDCSPPPGYVFWSGDCDDNDPTINPGAPEICWDGVDNNCDGNIDEQGCETFGMCKFEATIRATAKEPYCPYGLDCCSAVSINIGIDTNSSKTIAPGPPPDCDFYILVSDNLGEDIRQIGSTSGEEWIVDVYVSFNHGSSLPDCSIEDPNLPETCNPFPLLSWNPDEFCPGVSDQSLRLYRVNSYGEKTLLIEDMYQTTEYQTKADDAVCAFGNFYDTYCRLPDLPYGSTLSCYKATYCISMERITEDDADQDGVSDSIDNCPYRYNQDQIDTDRDGVEDVCDNCPDLFNPEQIDYNNNGIGDDCEGPTYQAMVIPITNAVYLDEAEPNKNFNSPEYNQYLEVGTDPDTEKEKTILLSFETASLPENAQIIRADLGIYLAGDSNDGDNFLLWLVNYGPWIEDNVTSSNSPLIGKSLGFQYACASYLAGDVTGATKTKRGRWMFFDIRGAVNDWLKGHRPNYGLAICKYAKTGSPDFYRFLSDESPGGGTPFVIIKYSVTQVPTPTSILDQRQVNSIKAL